MDADELLELIESRAAEPEEASGDGQSARERSIPDLIKLHQYKAATSAAASAGGSGSGWKMCRAARGVPPGGTG